MVDKEGMGFLHKAMNPCSPPPLLFFSSSFFCYNSTIARASSVVMETNVESQLWFCLGSPLSWSSVGTSLGFFFSLWLCLLWLQWWNIVSLVLTWVCDIGWGSYKGFKFFWAFVSPCLKCSLRDTFSCITQVGLTEQHSWVWHRKSTHWVLKSLVK